jgi:hypothetical protein
MPRTLNASGRAISAAGGKSLPGWSRYPPAAVFRIGTNTPPIMKTEIPTAGCTKMKILKHIPSIILFAGLCSCGERSLTPSEQISNLYDAANVLDQRIKKLESKALDQENRIEKLEKKAGL